MFKIKNRIGLGCGIGGAQAGKINHSILEPALIKATELGFSLLDTSAIYGAGSSEDIIGKVLSTQTKRPHIATKFDPKNSSYSLLIESAQNSLKRLRIDCIDLFQIHWPSSTIPLEETLDAMLEIKKKGLVRELGVCNLLFDQLKLAHSILGPHLKTVQYEYNLLERSVENEILPFCEKNNLYLLAYTPLLRGAYVNGSTRRKFLEQIALKQNATMAQIVLAWMHYKSPHIIPLPNSTKPDRVEEFWNASQIKISSDNFHQILNSCGTQITFLDPSDIDASHLGYRTLDDAIKNFDKLSPSPLELAEELKLSKKMKPLRVSLHKDFPKKYSLNEGRLRFWAWCLAFRDQEPVPALIIED